MQQEIEIATQLSGLYALYGKKIRDVVRLQAELKQIDREIVETEKQFAQFQEKGETQ